MKKPKILFFLMLFFIAPLYAQNLVLNTTLNDASSITSPDTGPAGTINNGSFTTAKYGNGFLSDGNNEYITFGIGSTSSTHESGKLNLDKGTIAFWYKPSSVGQSYFVSIGSYPGRFLIQIEDDFGNLSFWVYPGSANRNLGSITYSSGDLIHIAVVWKNSGSSEINSGDTYGVYINGSLLGSYNGTWSTDAFSSSTMYVGSQFGTSGYSNGVMDDFYIYDEVLTSTQINNLKDTQALPVELSGFSARVNGDKVELHWSTATEVNNFGFEVQKSVVSSQNTEWFQVGFVNGHGNSNSPKEYSFMDNNSIAGDYSYRLKQIDNDGTFEYSDVVEVSFSVPENFALEQNYPNPFNPTTKIKYSVPDVGASLMRSVTLKVYDVLGTEVATLVNEQKPEGNYEIEFNAIGLSSGIYFYTLTAGSFIQTKKMLMLK